MAENIEHVDLDPNLPDDYEEEQQQEETNVDAEDADWRDESVIIINGYNPDATKNVRKDVGSKLGKMAGVIRRGYVEDQKNLREIGIKNINKGDGPNATTLFDKLKLTHNEKGKISGAEFDGVKIIVLKGKTLMEYFRDLARN